MTHRFEELMAGMQRRVATGMIDGQPTDIVIAGRTYPTDVLDLWDAVTNADRLARWFLPISGDLKLGGRYQFEGNAGGTIQECVKPERIKATWEFGGGVSWVTVILTPLENATRLELQHEAHRIPGFTDVYGPGAVGVGWDGGFFGLGLHLQDPTGEKPPEADPQWYASAEGRAFYESSARAWGLADEASGTPADIALQRAENTRAFYTGEVPGMGGGEE